MPTEGLWKTKYMGLRVWIEDAWNGAALLASRIAVADVMVGLGLDVCLAPDARFS
jgi:hypothetical protein